MKRIGIEGSLFFKPRTGVAQYAYKLTEAAAHLDSDIRFEIIRHVLPLKKIAKPLPPNDHLSYRLVRWFPPALYFQVFKRLGWFIPYDLVALRRYRAVIFFNFVRFSLSPRAKGVVVIHDLSYLHFPQYVLAKNLKFLRRFVPRSISKAAHILAVSAYTKHNLIEQFKLPPDKISVVPNAIDHSIFYPRSAAEIAKTRSKYKLPTNYIHFHGTIEPRKNVVGLLRAYADLPVELRSRYELVLSGGCGWNDQEIYAVADELKLSGDKINFTGRIDTDEELAAIYSGASLFVLPSHFEGFGIPPLEAMACGIPVITSDNSSLPEVVGDAAIKVNAQDTAELTKQMIRVLSEPKLAANLRSKGLAQAAKLSWDKSAQELIKVLDQLVD